MRRLALVLEYDGTRYAGFQRQPGLPTVQGEVEEALRRFLGAPVRVQGAGRTDGGVHALGQVAAFSTEAPYPPETVQRALNHFLPPDIRVRGAFEVSPSFHPRRDARRREYLYLFLTGPAPSALWRDRALFLPFPLDWEAMARAAALLPGRRDFAPFCGAPPPRCRGTVREVFHARIERRGRFLLLRMEADAFLPHQVRRTAGALLQVGRGRMGVEEFRHLLLSSGHGEAGPALPAHALYLVRVVYPNDIPPAPAGGFEEALDALGETPHHLYGQALRPEAPVAPY